MHSTKLISILRTFRSDEWRKCKKYVLRHHGKETREMRLYEYIHRYHGDIDGIRMNIETVQQVVAPAINEKSFRNVIYRLTGWVLDFITHDTLEHPDNRLTRMRLSAQWYRDRGLYDLFDSSLRDMRHETDRGDKIDLFQPLERLMVSHLDYFSEKHYKVHKRHEVLWDAARNLHMFYDNLRQFYEIEMRSSQKLYRQTPPVDIWESADSLVGEVLHFLDSLESGKSARAYYALKEHLFQPKKRFSPGLEEVILIRLLNDCFRRAKSGEIAVIDDIAQLYIWGLETGTLLHHGKLTETRFINIIEALSKSGVDWEPETFLERWLPAVETPDMQMVLQLAWAMWYFSVDRFDEALEALGKANFERTQIIMAIRYHQIRMCSLVSTAQDFAHKKEFLESERAYFKRIQRRISRQNFQGALNLIRVAGMMWDGAGFNEVKEYLAGCDSIMCNHWIQGRLKKMTPLNAARSS